MDTDTEIKKQTVYCITKKIKDENYDVYVGSTCLSLDERLRLHKVKAKANLSRNENNKFYKRMREAGLDAWEIKPLLVLLCDEKKIRRFERNWKETLEANLNTNSPLRTEEELKEYKREYYEQNKDKILKKQADYYEQKKDQILQKQADYYKENIQYKSFTVLHVK